MPGAANAGRTPPHILTLVLLGGVAALTMNMFLPSLPGMAQDFRVDYAGMQLSVTAYLAASAMVQFLAGPISDSFGRRPVMLWALAIFVLATLGTLVAPSVGWFLAFRMMQAVISVGIVASRAVIRDIAPPDRAASLIGYVTMGVSVIPMMAPVLGGALDEAFGWRANFVVLGAAGLAVGVLAFVDMGETARPGGRDMRAQIATYPLLLRSRQFWGYCLAATLASGAFFAYLGGAPFVGGTVFAMSPAQVGYWFMAPSIGYLAGNFIAGRFSQRFGMNRMIAVGATVASAGLGASLALDLIGISTPSSFFGAVALMGLGNGMLLPNANAGIMSVRADLAGTASGLGGAMMIGGGAALAAIAGSLLTPGAGATPLLTIMAATSVGSLLALGLVRRR